ncbi:hypothetical protein PROFUN_04312 [Planoprotostelium fungivorum]|uniref:Uncharacterized protein n=1 Tax=Planoprotostelium fungivorum TaxID=1890364 RepID=A0A2P6NVF5_9EUKA|nr:hypothetical protein PROFUN_04312 [Planoprotostelium fungivorum]
MTPFFQVSVLFSGEMDGTSDPPMPLTHAREAVVQCGWVFDLETHCDLAWVKDESLFRCPSFDLKESNNGEHLESLCVKSFFSRNGPVMRPITDLACESEWEDTLQDLAKALRRNDNITRLKFSGLQMGDYDAEVLANGLSKNKKVTSLDLSSMYNLPSHLYMLNIHIINKISAQGARWLAEGLRKNQTLTEIDLSSVYDWDVNFYNRLKDEGVLHICEALKTTNNTLSRLVLSGMNSKGAMMLAGCLQKNSSLTHLNLEGNEGTEETLKAQNIQSKITELYLCDNNITEGGLSLVFSSSEWKHLQVLGLRQCIGRAEISRSFSLAIQNNKNIKTLMLRDNLKGQQAEIIYAGLTLNTSITHLDLTGSCIDEREATEIGECLKRNQTIQILNLTDTRLGVKGGEAISNGLGENSSLIELVLAGNDVGNSIEGILKALKAKSKLQVLNLQANNIDTEHGMTIASYLKSNSSLTELDISENPLSTGGIAVVLNALKDRPVQTKLHMNICIEAPPEHILPLIDTIVSSLKEKLSALSLSGNGLTREMLSLLINMLQVKSTKLVYLNLAGSGNDNMNLDDINNLIETLSSNNCLEVLNLSYCGIGTEGAQMMADFLRRDTTLTKMILKGNTIETSGIQALYQTFKYKTRRHKTLQIISYLFDLSRVDISDGKSLPIETLFTLFSFSQTTGDKDIDIEEEEDNVLNVATNAQTVRQKADENNLDKEDKDKEKTAMKPHVPSMALVKAEAPASAVKATVASAVKQVLDR